MVAYTPDVEHGVIDKQIRLTPGRYLERFYAEMFDRETIARYVADVSANCTDYKIARTVADVRKVYRNGPSSCMGGPEHHTGQYWTESGLNGHMPAEIYAEPGDLAVAYFGSIDSPSQRSVVWPERKIYVRIYGTGPLETLLRRDGFTKGEYDGTDVYGSIEGAKVPAISVRGGWLMPYVDGCEHATVDGKWIVFDEDGEIGTQSTAGVVWESGDRDEDEEDEDQDEYGRCDHCQSRELVDDLESGLCSSCYAEHWTCDGCHGSFYEDETQTTIGDDYYCESCTRDHTETCQDEDCSAEWIEQNEFTDEETERRKRYDLADLCPSCYARYAFCEHCEKPHDQTICPDCNRSPRCEHTLDLLATIEPEPTQPAETLACNCSYCRGALQAHVRAEIEQTYMTPAATGQIASEHETAF
jgi:hypothetical protein